jgi:hypothetical protein
MSKYVMTEDNNQEYLEKFRSALTSNEPNRQFDPGLVNPQLNPQQNSLEELVKSALINYFEQNPNVIGGLMKNMLEDEQFGKHLMRELFQDPNSKTQIQIIIERVVKHRIKGMMRGVLKGLFKNEQP